jgi:hypothetical protein
MKDGISDFEQNDRQPTPPKSASELVSRALALLAEDQSPRGEFYRNRFPEGISAEEKTNEYTRENFAGLCKTMSTILKEVLAPMGVDVRICRSGSEHWLSHYCLVLNEPNKEEILIDPTIGQFVVGHNHAFIGTRQELKELFLTQVGNGKKYQISSIAKNENELPWLFESLWGDTSAEAD